MNQPSEKSGKVVFKEYDQDQLVLLPPSLEELIPSHHLVRIINGVVEGIDLGLLEQAYVGGGASNYHPKMMLKVLIYAYSTKIYSCRQIAASLEKDIHFMWLSAMQRPSFRTINGFRSGAMKKLIEEVFGQVLSFLIAHHYVKLENYFVDGTKLRADAHKYSHVWASNTERYKKSLHQRIEGLLKEIDELNHQEDERYGENHLEAYGEKSSLTSEGLYQKVDQLNADLSALQHTEGTTKKKVRTKKSKANQLKKCADKLAVYEQQQQVLNGRRSYSKTDPDATFMRMKDDQLFAGYNIINGTENQFIVHYTIHQSAGETNEFVNHFKKLEQRTAQLPKNVIGDAAYGSEENYDYITERKIGNYLKYSGFYFENTNRYKENRFHKDHFAYDKGKDQFTCPNNQPLDFQYQTVKTSRSGYKSKIRVYECQQCADCSLSTLCKKGTGNKKIKFSPGFEAYKQQVRQNLQTDKGIRLRKQRGVDVETPFANIKHNMNYHRFRLRGIDNVNMEWGLLSMAHNLRKASRLVA